VGVDDADLNVLGVFNEDFSVNSSSNPAPAGSILILYVSGAGQTSPASLDGQLNVGPFAAPALPVSVEWLINNPNSPTFLPITCASSAPGLVAGIFQVNFMTPAQSVITLDLMVGTSIAQFSVFVQ
jgi:uncharacterized protein (TIGR03437 family)